jgi:tetratricopeptide (TPR) repeat protein
MRRLLLALIAALAVFMLLNRAPSAQELAPAERAALQAKKEALFQQMLRNPSNLDATFAYADVSAKLGDNEAAVSALERMLLFNPNLPRVQLELGALYFRMGSFAIARSYFDKVLAAHPPADVRRRVDAYLGQITQASSSHHITGFLSAGVQYQTDANLAPGCAVCTSLIPGFLIPLTNQFVKAGDADFFTTGAAQYSYDLGTQNRDTFEVGGVGFADRYLSFTRLDLDVVELTAGPRFNFRDPLPQVSAASLKPYLIANDVALGQHQYFHSWGLGGETTALLGRDWHFKGIFEFRDKNFDDASDRPQSRGLTGTDKLLSLFLNKPVTAAPQSDLTLELDFLDQETRFAFFANKTYSVSLAYHLQYDDPTHWLQLPWDTTLYGAAAWSNYAAPQFLPNGLAIFPTRHDAHWRFGVTQSFPIRDNVAIVLQLQRDIVSSNISVYAYTSDSVLIGPHIRF